MDKKCFRCLKVLNIDEFYVHKQMGDGHLGKCKECARKDVRVNRKLRKRKYDLFDKYRYRNDIDRLLVHKYIGMKKRIFGQARHSNLVGKDLLSKDEFLGWCKDNMVTFMKIYSYWKKGGYRRKLAPSIDRIDNNLGYVVGNMQWLTQQENSKKYNN